MSSASRFDPRAWRLRARVLAGFAMVMSLLLAAAGVGVLRIAQLSERIETLVEVDVRALELSRVWAASSETNIQRRVVALAVDDAEFVKAFTRRVSEVSKRVEDVQKQIEELPKSPEAEAMARRVGEKRKEYQTLRSELYKLKEAGTDVRSRVTKELIPMMEEYVDTVVAFADLVRKQLDHDKAEAQAQARSTLYTMVALLGLATLLGVVIALAITRSVVAPVAHANEVSAAIASGDLRTRISSSGHDELADLTRGLQSMQDQLGETIAGIRGAAEQVRQASDEIAHGNLDLSQRTEQAASSLEQTGAAMQQLNEAVRGNVEAVRQADALARSAADVAERGGAMVSQVVQTMAAIQSASSKISDIIGVIDGIAFQTNILALNAAVEAARAGEQGRGFAVVAGEVRALAQRSAAAAREIKTLIMASVEQVNGGSQLVHATGETIADVVQNVQRVNRIVAEISQATAAQADTLGEVGQAVEQLDQLTQQNSALVEQSAAAAQGLREQASQLTQTVSRFRLPGA